MGEPRRVLPDDALTEHIGSGEPTRGSEPSQYPEEEKAISDSLSSGERNGTSLNRCNAKPAGVVAPGSWDRTFGGGSPRRQERKRRDSGTTLRTGGQRA
jgi:hypothetical protein